MLQKSILFCHKMRRGKRPRAKKRSSSSPEQSNEISSIVQGKEYVFRAFDSIDESTKTKDPIQKTDINMAYCPPKHSSPVSFGKKVLRLQKPTNYWKLVQKHRLFSWKYIWIRSLFLICMSYLLAVLWDEVRRIEEDQRRGGRGQYALVGDSLGKEVAPVSQRDIWDDDKVNEMILQAQESFMAGEGSASAEDYEMVKIKRPKEFTFDDIRKR